MMKDVTTVCDRMWRMTADIVAFSGLHHGHFVRLVLQ